MVPGAWAPTNATWGVENRTTALRVIPGSASSQRIEYRVVAADTNPYLALAAVLGSGLAGIEQKLTATDAIQGNAYEQQTSGIGFTTDVDRGSGTFTGINHGE